MRFIENAIIAVAGLGFLGTVVLALFAVGNLIAQGPGNPNVFQHQAPQVATGEDGQTKGASATPGSATEVAKNSSITAAPGNNVASGNNNATATRAPDRAPQGVQANVSIDVAKGATVFKKCKACHTVEENDKDKVGPNLWGIVNGKVAAREGFKYSDAMAKLQGKTWDVEFLDAYLTKPRAVIKGTKMAFAGLKKQTERNDLIAYLATFSHTPLSPQDLGLTGQMEAGQSVTAVTAAPASQSAESPAGNATAEETVSTVVFTDPPEKTDEEKARIAAAVVALKTKIKDLDYQRAMYHPLHFAPNISKASNEECLVCHEEIMRHKPRTVSPAGVRADETLAWYQTLDTYEGKQETFHYRHLESPFAKKVMNLSCNFCHQGNDPREETPDMLPGKPAFTAAASPAFTLRKVVNPSQTCLLCHGAMPDPVTIMGMQGPWHETRGDFEDETTPNGCLSCHQELFRTVRHQVNYLKAAGIEDAAKTSSDTCYGCHGGRQWYRISYPYTRTPWPDMDEEVPEWAKGRPTETNPRFRINPQ